MNDQNSDKKNLEWAILIILGLIFFISLVCFFTIPRKTDIIDISTLALELIPNVMASIITFFAAYYAFSVRGIKLRDNIENNLIDLKNKISVLENSLKNQEITSQLIIEKIEPLDGIWVIEDKLRSLLGDPTPNWISNGFEKHTEVPWSGFLENSTKVVLVAFYFEKWMVKHREILIDFLRKDNAKLIIYLPNYYDLNLLKQVRELIPALGNRENLLADKIDKTIRLLKDLADDNISFFDKIEVRLYNKVFSYTMQIFDDREILLSVNEMSRSDRRYNSPYIVFDICESHLLKQFFTLELRRVDTKSTNLDLKAWKSQN